jgi:pyrrolidone-carboxylate peptidase
LKIRAAGFGPFLDVQENPSGILALELAKSLSLDVTVLEVSFHAADDFASSIQPGEGILMLGVNTRAEKIILETTARNKVGMTADVTGEVRGPAPVQPGAPNQLGGTLFRREEIFLDDRWTLGTDAGDYLCNYLYYQALWTAPEALCGFVHVPPFEVLAREEQASILSDLLELVKTNPI